MVGEEEGDGQLWGSGRGAIAGCHCSVVWWGKGRVTANFGGSGRGCHCRVPLLCGMVGEEEGDGQLWGSGRGAIAGCHCSVVWWGKGRVTANFGGVDVVPLQGGIVVWYGGGRGG